MLDSLKVTLPGRDLINAIKVMKKKEREAFLEEMLAATAVNPFHGKIFSLVLP